MQGTERLLRVLMLEQCHQTQMRVDCTWTGSVRSSPVKFRGKMTGMQQTGWMYPDPEHLSCCFYLAGDDTMTVSLHSMLY